MLIKTEDLLKLAKSTPSVIWQEAIDILCEDEYKLELHSNAKTAIVRSGKLLVGVIDLVGDDIPAEILQYIRESPQPC
ncbi:hypothetical protein D9M68_699850 [compost metagenome]